MNTDFDFDSVGQVDAEAPEQKPLPKLNFGKPWLKTLRYIRWENKQPIEIDAKEFKATDPKKRSQEVEVGIDIQEFNPELSFTYKRKFNVGDVDWNKTFIPGILTALDVKPLPKKHEGYAKQVAMALRTWTENYWVGEDVPQEKYKNAKEGEKVFSTCKPVKMFATREACFAEWKSTYKRDGELQDVAESATGTNGHKGPGEFSAKDWAEIAPEVVKHYNAELSKATGAPAMKAKRALEATATEFGVTPDDVKAVLA